MRNVLGIMLAVMLVVGFAGISSAEDQIAASGEKLVKGTQETATSFTELPKEMYNTGKENPLLGITAGTVNGSEKVVLRTTEGAIDVGTFYLPESNRPLAHPVQNRSVGEKLADGGTGVATGWTELPIEMYETGKENPLKGLTAGVVNGSEKVVFRTTEGAIDLGAFFLPDSKRPSSQNISEESSPARTARPE